MMMDLLTALYLLLVAPCGNADEGMRLQIQFLEEPAYHSCWLPWEEDRFLMALELTNCAVSTYAIRTFAPCNDCNPRLFVRSESTGREPERTRELDILYAVNDSSFVDLEPLEVYTDTIDWAEFIRYDLKRGVSYQVWIELKPWGADYQFEDTTRTTSIWPFKVVSDTLEFTH